MNTAPHDAVGVVHDYSATQSPGLTKREYFAALAMQALLSSPVPHSPDGVDIAWVSDVATNQADRLIEELNK